MEDIQTKEFKVYCCPSKVLIMGGYAILSEQCVGLSVGLNEKFYSYITPSNEDNSSDQHKKQIKFISRQIESEWIYEIDTNKKQLIASDLNNSNKNPFLESVVQVIVEEGLNDITKLNHSIQVHIYHDNRFYSLASQKQEQKSKYFSMFDKNNLHKTGLGSSACVLVVTLGTLLKYFNEYTEEKLHFLSQKANYIAQKKIGSGFDIATSVFGSQVYKRFPPEIFSANTQLNYKWDIYTRFNIPNELKVMMIDLSIGSDTRVLAGEIKKYLDSHPMESQNFYEQNNNKAKKLQEIFSGIKSLNDLKENKTQILELNQEYRRVFKDIGIKANVETEPDVLSTILDQILSEVSSVYYGVCPGAGGYDALCLLTERSLSLEELQSKLNHIKTYYPTIKEMIAQEIDISLEGFRQLDQTSTSVFLNNLL